mmetsp:Transcript_17713/g.57936  ORF Transcript_17713/g.57936 Transcript_17713/m.57936 type:complete len:368 (+) Transcript_17713:841-1944(+)
MTRSSPQERRRAGEGVADSLALRARLDDEDGSVCANDSFDILGHAVTGLFDGDGDVGDAAEERNLRLLVPDDGFGVVVDEARGGLNHGDALVEPSARVAFEVFAVGVGAENERLVGEETDALGGVALHLGRGARRLVASKSKRAARIVADESLAEAAHQLGVNLVGVFGTRVGGVDDKRVLSRDDWLAEHAHAEPGVVDTNVARRNVGTVVPLGGPDAGDGAPCPLEESFVRGDGRDGGHLEGGEEGVSEVVGAHHRACGCAAGFQRRLRRRGGGGVDGCFRERQVVARELVQRQLEKRLESPKRKRHRGRQTDPFREPARAQAVVQQASVESLGTHHTLAELRERNDVFAAKGDVGERHPAIVCAG